MVPANVFEAAANDQMLGLIFFSLMFGYFMMRIGNGNAELMRGFWQGVSDTMMSLTMWIMKFAPLGVFGLVAKTVADTGFAAFKPLLLFVVTVLLGFVFHTCVTIALLVKVLGDAGRHARSAVGVNALPMDAAVEIEAIFQIARA